jgi:hypothetical protein
MSLFQSKQSKAFVSKSFVLFSDFATQVSALVESLDETGEDLSSMNGALAGRWGTFGQQIIQAVANRRNTTEAKRQGSTADSRFSGPITINPPEPVIPENPDNAKFKHGENIHPSLRS